MKRLARGPTAGLLALGLAWAAWVVPTDARPTECSSATLHVDPGLNLRGVFTHTRRVDAEKLLEEGSARRRDSGLGLARARFELDAICGDHWSGRLVYDSEWLGGRGLSSLEVELGRTLETGTWADLDRTISDHRDGLWRHGLYRGWVRYRRDGLEVTLGRQRIALGRGRLWTPTDLFNPISPLAIEGDQRIGQDAGLVRVSLRPGLVAAGIWSPQNDPDEHRAALRLEWSDPALDAAWLVGRIERDWVVGVDFARNLGGAAVRGEATYTNLHRGERIWQVVASIDHTFALGSGVYTLVEHFYNENRFRRPDLGRIPRGASLDVVEAGVPEATERGASRFASTGRHQTGLQVGYDLSPLLRADLLWIHDWSGPSEAVVPSLGWSPRGDLEIGLGVQLFVGRDERSEFGDRPGIVFLRIDYYR